MKIFNSFSEKEKHFNCVKVMDVNALKNELDKYKETEIVNQFLGNVKKRYFFRGVSNASYRMYSSLQRCCFDRKKEGYPINMPQLSQEILRRFNSNKIIQEAYRKEVAESNLNSQLTKWAFIQHYGGPSHFIDFTSDTNVALHFAIPEKASECEYNDNEEDLNNYMSIYIYIDNPHKNGNLNLLYESSSESARNLFVDAKKHIPNTIITNEVDTEMIEQPLQPKLWGASIYGEKAFGVINIADGSVQEMSFKNSHILKQKGNFYADNINGLEPLEVAPKLKTYGQPYGYCIDIHKSLIDHIKEEFDIPSDDDIYTPMDYIKEAKAELKKLWESEL